MPGNLFNLPMMNGQAGKYLQVNSTETDYQWEDIGVLGQAYRTIESDGTPEVQRNILNFSALFTVGDNILNLSTDVDIDVSALANDSTFIADLIANSTFTTDLASDSNFITELSSNATFVEDIANNSDFITALSTNVTFVEDVANNSDFYTTLAGNTTFISDLTAESTFISAITNIVTTGGGLPLETNGTPNGDQGLLNLVQGTGMTITDDGLGNITFDATGSGTGNAVTETVHQVAHGFSQDNAIKSSGTDGEYALAQADSASDAEAVGIVTDVIDADNFTYTLIGIATLTAIPGAAVAGDTIYLDASSAGALTDTAPVTVGEVSKPMAVVIDATAKTVLVYQYRGIINQ